MVFLRAANHEVNRPDPPLTTKGVEDVKRSRKELTQFFNSKFKSTAYTRLIFSLSTAGPIWETAKGIAIPEPILIIANQLSLSRREDIQVKDVTAYIDYWDRGQHVIIIIGNGHMPAVLAETYRNKIQPCTKKLACPDEGCGYILNPHGKIESIGTATKKVSILRPTIRSV